MEIKKPLEHIYWTERGASRKLNSLLVNLTNQGIGYIPLSNLLPETEKMNKAILGAKVKLEKLPEGGEEIYLFVK